jgi:hypothetical protein
MEQSSRKTKREGKAARYGHAAGAPLTAIEGSSRVVLRDLMKSLACRADENATSRTRLPKINQVVVLATLIGTAP